MNCAFFSGFLLFLAGSFLGDVVETIYCRIVEGVWMSRSSVVWGPFSIVWGLGITLLIILLYRYKDRSDVFLFCAGSFLGGVYEYACSVFTEIALGKVFWEYSHIPFNLGGRINLLYCFFWGIVAVVWMKRLYPKVSKWIDKFVMRMGKTSLWALIIFMGTNIAVSGLALIRSTERVHGIEAEEAWQQIMDKRFPDERLAKIYPNMIQIE